MSHSKEGKVGGSVQFSSSGRPEWWKTDLIEVPSSNSEVRESITGSQFNSERDSHFSDRVQVPLKERAD